MGGVIIMKQSLFRRKVNPNWQGLVIN